MKTLSHIKFILPALILAACGVPGNKKPVSDIQEIREKATSEMNGTNKPAPTPPVVAPKEVNTTQDKANERFFKIELDKKDSPLRFYEQKTNTAKFYLRVMDSSLRLSLQGKDLPAGAALKDVSTVKEPNVYELNWTPALNTVGANEESPKMMMLTLAVVVDAEKTPAAKVALLKGLQLEKVMTFAVFKGQEKPSALVITGLNGKAEEGQIVPFNVVVRIPGVDESSTAKPTLALLVDEGAPQKGVDYREMDGRSYVTNDDSRAPVEYLGDFKWKFNLLFDTKNNRVEDQKAKDGSVMANADTTHVRFGIKVNAPFTAAPVTVMQVAIKRLPSESSKVTEKSKSSTPKKGK
jgi:hypothetical protein